MLIACSAGRAVRNSAFPNDAIKAKVYPLSCIARSACLLASVVAASAERAAPAELLTAAAGLKLHRARRTCICMHN